MDVEDYKRVIKMGNWFSSNDYDFRKELFENQKLLSSSWNDDFRNKYNDPPIKEDSITYDNCFKSLFSLEENELLCGVTVWDGDLLNGQPIDKRCYFTFQIINPSDILNDFFRYKFIEILKTTSIYI